MNLSQHVCEQNRSINIKRLMSKCEDVRKKVEEVRLKSCNKTLSLT